MNCTGKRCIMQFDKVDPATCKCVSYCPQATPPKTNADRIRSMTDEELAKWFTSVCTAKSTCSCMDCAFDALMYCGFGDWLKQEATE